MADMQITSFISGNVNNCCHYVPFEESVLTRLSLDVAHFCAMLATYGSTF